MKSKMVMYATLDLMFKMKKIRVRYAPSPTGKLHIGGARTALFNYLFAKHYNGEFMIRLEDTDQKRNVEGGELDQINGLEWLGITADISPLKDDGNGPYRQSERLDIYQKYVDILLKLGMAYECYCTPEELEASRDRQLKNGSKSPKYDRKCLLNSIKKPGATPSIRLKVPDNEEYTWDDGVRGKISVPSYAIGDWVIKKSDGMFTYNFANVIDDYLMEITDVMRGEEHIANTPKQLMLYKMFNWTPPKFYHLTIITNEDGKKLSKRDESLVQFINLFKELGYLPEAVFNFLALLGWTPKINEEIFSKQKLIEIFDENRFSKSPSMFNIQKLKWTNNYYIKKLSEDELFNFLNPYVKDVKLSDEKKRKIFLLFQPQLNEGIEIKKLIKLFEKNVGKINTESKTIIDENIDVLELFLEKIETIEWNSIEIKNEILKIGEILSKKGAKLLKPLRLSISGYESGPDLSTIIEIFGREKTKTRLLEYLNEK